MIGKGLDLLNENIRANFSSEKELQSSILWCLVFEKYAIKLEVKRPRPRIASLRSQINSSSMAVGL